MGERCYVVDRASPVPTQFFYLLSFTFYFVLMTTYTLSGLPAEEVRQARGSPLKTFSPQGKGKEI